MAIKTHGKLRMECEEILCPSVFTGKKKYFGVIYKPGELHPRDSISVKTHDAVLLKGIDFIKQQYPDLIKKHGYALTERILNHFNDDLKALNENDRD